MLLGGGERLQQEVRGLVQYVHEPPTILSTGTLAAVGYMDIRQHVKNIKIRMSPYERLVMCRPLRVTGTFRMITNMPKIFCFLV